MQSWYWLQSNKSKKSLSICWQLKTNWAWLNRESKAKTQNWLSHYSKSAKIPQPCEVFIWLKKIFFCSLTVMLILWFKKKISLVWKLNSRFLTSYLPTVFDTIFLPLTNSSRISLHLYIKRFFPKVSWQ